MKTFFVWYLAWPWSVEKLKICPMFPDFMGLKSSKPNLAFRKLQHKQQCQVGWNIPLYLLLHTSRGIWTQDLSVFCLKTLPRLLHFKSFIRFITKSMFFNLGSEALIIEGNVWLGQCVPKNRQWELSIWFANKKEHSLEDFLWPF